MVFSISDGKSLLTDLSSAQHIDQGCLSIVDTRNRMIRFSNNYVTVSKFWRDIVTAIYILKNNKRATAVIDNTNLESIKNVIDRLITTFTYGQPSPIRFTFPEGPFDYAPIEGMYDVNVLSNEDVLLDWIEASTNSSLSEGAVRASGVLTTSDTTRYVVTTSGCEGEEKSTQFEFNIRAFADKNASGEDNYCSSNIINFNPEAVGTEAGSIAVKAKKPQHIKAGRYDAILHPNSVANFIASVGESCSAYYVDTGFSFFTDKLNKKVASPKITCSENLRFPGSPSNHLFDDEGVPTKEVLLIDKGILTNYLHSSYTAAKMKSTVTGNAFIAPPVGTLPIPQSLILNSGKYSLEELLSEVNNGIFVTNNWYTRFQNYLTGDFSSIPRDGLFLIKKGELTSIKGLRISDNMINFLTSITGLTTYRKWIKRWDAEIPTLSPYLLVSNMNFTSAE